ncbi:hypothetical protein Q5752_004562 [Cryptotrichosporon argae]
MSADREQLMFLGQECHHSACHLHDFLPFSCPACHQSFCQPHFLPSAHACAAPLPPSMVDRIAPQCPLCQSVVNMTTPAGRIDPNEAVERHILGGTCAGLPDAEEKRKAELRARKQRGEVCWKKGCPKVLVVQIRCPNCTHSFCPSHRHAESHSCTSTPSSSRAATPQVNAAPANAARAALSRLVPPALQKASTSASSSSAKPAPAPFRPQVPATTASSSQPLDARAAAAAAALRRAGQDVKVPFLKSKADKRAQEEAASQLKAMKARHDKGILSKTEEVQYAEMMGQAEATRRRGGGKDGKDGCVIG